MAQDYTNMSVQDKLKLADERLEKLKGTDKYDAFKERVDAMHKKYDVVRPGVKWDYEINKPSGSRIGDTREGLKEVLLGMGSLSDPHIGERVKITLKDGSYVVPASSMIHYDGNIPMPGAFTVYRRDPASPRDKNDVMAEKGYRREVIQMPLDEVYDRMRIFEGYPTLGTSQASKAGQADLTGMSNFLATDKVPDTIFGIPVVSRREDYTEEDIAFFQEHPEAGGYYDMGNEAAESQGAQKGGNFSDRANRAIAETVDFLRTHEGFRPNAYRDTEGVPTIGYGQTNILNRAVTMDDHGMSEPEARKWMERRVRENAVNLYKRHPWMQKLSTGALAAAYDLAYNMGDGVFTKASSPRFNRRLDAGEDPETVFWSELPTYVGGKDADAQTRKGLKNRRNDAIKRWKGVK